MTNDANSRNTLDEAKDTFLEFQRTPAPSQALECQDGSDKRPGLPIRHSSPKWMVITRNLEMLNSAKVSRLPNISYYRYMNVQQRFDTGARINELVAKPMEIRARLSENTVIPASYQEFQIKSMLKQHFPKVLIKRSERLQLFYDSQDSHMNYLNWRDVRARTTCVRNGVDSTLNPRKKMTGPDSPSPGDLGYASTTIVRVIYRANKACPVFNIAKDMVMSRTRMQQFVNGGVPQGTFETCCGFTIHQFQGDTDGNIGGRYSTIRQEFKTLFTCYAFYIPL
ncbi:hypothetical protein SARC_06946 [Sphaeroforma arctica JP610]|uniref:Uncharacterized protein n=1 Tax=Sphaeroforma arctica JP610 TaxID=667725 RepID=A0A0L0FV43_9EUKA|nr:hypothetical protein SARC_06946 [Sphaeroforma arctica JP610]KNC80697.1 hypothetical protein SARC_06946 [Sphaeroforma arctica JP610]|eukprot:XP_014154599.1 hypothetical protein SARC_06946 [Sphaeroforma arctica JP610]